MAKQQPDYRHKGDAVKKRVRDLILMGTSTAQILARCSVSKSYVTRVRQEIQRERKAN